MTTLPLTLQDEPVGIVVRTGLVSPPQAKIWAFLWAFEEEDAEEHLHQRLPEDRGRNGKWWR